MKKTFLCLLLGISILFTNCEENEEALKNKKEIQVKVLDAGSWNEEIGSDLSNLDKVANASVYLTSESTSLSGLTDSDGLITFRDVDFGAYFVKAEYNDLNSLLEIETIQGDTVGYLIKGVYTTEGELGGIPEGDQTIGDIKILDINADYKITPEDKTLGESIQFYEQIKDVNADGKIDEDDKVNGEYIMAENIIYVEIYVGKK